MSAGYLVLTDLERCTAEITREGYLWPCEKVAVAVALHEGEPYPVCKHHARGRPMVPLVELGPVIAAATAARMIRRGS